VVATPLAVAVGETVPHGPGEHDTVQVTPIFDGSPVTIAVICAVVPIGTVASLAVTETISIAPAMATAAELDADLLATEVAVIVTVKALGGGVLGAV
jgi:hypothetical protein